MQKNKFIGVISLGCDKNTCDTEKMLHILKSRHQIVTDPEDAQIIIINTCAFLESSRKEAIEEILSCAQLKKACKLEKLIVTGCLPQKFVSELYSALPEVDAFLGVSDYGEILSVIDGVYENRRINAVGFPRGECGTERCLTTKGYAYLKIADGCSNHCTYCLIPKIRGAYRSVPKAQLIKEAKGLGDVSELILVAQDVTRYGQDLEQPTDLVELIKELSLLDNVKGIRLLYCYPENVTDSLIHEFNINGKLIRYIDIPMQHADDGVLKLMNRKGTGKSYLELIEKLKNSVKGIAIRSTFITGFPGESEQAFENLVSFIRSAKLFNVGFFKYSREEGTASYNLKDQIPEKEKGKRLRKLYAEQKKVVKSNLSLLKNRTFSVFVEGFDQEKLVYYGRAYFNAPNIDGKVYFFSSEEVEFYTHVNVKIIKNDGYDLYGERI